jgi:VIT1/CCC1 family predicted Fe2+/Mn2+ transporter
MIEASGLLGLLVTLIIAGLIFYVLWWFVGFLGLPQPFDKVVRVIIALVAVVFLINLLLGLTGTPLFR